MFESDIAILGSGLIRYEAALLGTPSLVFSRNKNHARLVQEFADSELCVHGGIINDLPESKIANSILAIRGDLELRKKSHPEDINSISLAQKKSLKPYLKCQME